MKNRLKRIVLRLSESSKFSQTHKIFYPFPAKLTLQRSQHSPEAHWASTFSLHVIPSQQLSCSHSSRLPQSHSSSSSMILLPQLRRISSCVRGAVTERAKWNENEGFVCVISRSQTRMIRVVHAARFTDGNWEPHTADHTRKYLSFQAQRDYLAKYVCCG